MNIDYRGLVAGELGDFRDFLTTLDAAEWDSPSLCDGWAVRHVVGHICLGYHASLPWVAGQIVRERGNVARGSSRLSKQFGDGHTPEELLDLFSQYADHGAEPKRGLARVLPSRDRMTDHVIHHEDCRRAMGNDREIPKERLEAALDALPHIGGFLASKKTCAGLAFEATDLDWSHRCDDRPVVRGPGRDLLLAMSGRPLGLDSLEGDGVATLTARIKSGR